MPGHIAYYQYLHLYGVIKKLCYRFSGKPIVYGIRCVVTGMVYVGCTSSPQEGFFQHLVAPYSSNHSLQEAIGVHGLSKFVVIIFEVLEFPAEMSAIERKRSLLAAESRYIAKFPKARLYNN